MERDRMVLVIAAVGTSGSGKTTTLEYLISNLAAEGYRVGSIKHIHHKGFTMDREGTNTWRYAKAGSKVIVAISPDEIAVIKKTDAALNDLDQIIELLEREQLDIIFLEGFHGLIAKRKDVPKIITAKDADNLRRTLEGTAPPILAVTGTICQQSGESGLEIPLIDVPAEGERLLKLVKDCIQCKQSPSETNSETAVH
jgi:molybdopterin-guanine dinucleotide biosynthesis protein B